MTEPVKRHTMAEVPAASGPWMIGKLKKYKENTYGQQISERSQNGIFFRRKRYGGTDGHQETYQRI